MIWDFKCPRCNAEWNNEGDVFNEGDTVEDECPKCGAKLLITASYSVNYDVVLDMPDLAEGARK